MENFFLCFVLYVCGNYHIMEPLLEIDGKIVHIIDFWLSNSGYLDWNLKSFRLEPSLGILVCVSPSQEVAE